jgi:hypothetical protein
LPVIRKNHNSYYRYFSTPSSASTPNHYQKLFFNQSHLDT